jgi:hypothetical protein
LDTAVEKAVGPGYQKLKNLYGSLRTLENDVVKRAVVHGRQNVGGGLMGSIGDVVSAEEVIRGLVHLNPASMAIGAGVKGTTTLAKYLRNPNRAVKRLFEKAEGGSTTDPGREILGGTVRRAAPVGAIDLAQALRQSGAP